MTQTWTTRWCLIMPELIHEGTIQSFIRSFVSSFVRSLKASIYRSFEISTKRCLNRNPAKENALCLGLGLYPVSCERECTGCRCTKHIEFNILMLTSKRARRVTALDQQSQKCQPEFVKWNFMNPIVVLVQGSLLQDNIWAASTQFVMYSN